MSEERIVLWDQWNRFSGSVVAPNPKVADALIEILKGTELVRSIGLYTNDSGGKSEKKLGTWNYTVLKEHRVLLNPTAREPWEDAR